MIRDITLEDTFRIQFTTRQFSDGVPTTLAGSPVLSVLEENNATPITAGVTVSVDRASVAGLNEATIVATAANGYETGKSYGLYISTGTVGGVSVIGEVVENFTIDKVRDSILSDGVPFKGADVGAIFTDMSTKADILDKLGAVDEAAAAGDPSALESVMQYVKQIVNLLAGSDGIATMPAGADPANAVNLFEMVRAGLGATFATATDSLEGIRDRGDAAWTTGGGTGLTALASGTAQSGTASTIVLASAESFADNELNGNVVNIHAGTGAGQSRVILSNTLADDTCNVFPNWATNPSSDSQYEIVQGSANVSAISLDGTAADNLESACDNYSVTRGLTGTALPAAAADTPFGVPISDAGNLDLDTILDVAISTRLAPTIVGRTLDVTTTGAAGLDWGNVENQNATVDLSATDIQLCDTITTYTGDTPQTADHTAAIADIPTVSEFNARTIVSANYFDPAADTVANVTTVGTTTTNTDMRGTDSAALASVCTEGRLAELDAANVPADIADVPTVAEFNARTLVAASYFDPAADTVANVTTVATTTTNTDMRGTDGANTTVPDAAGVAPTAVENRQEMDSNSTQLAAILAKLLAYFRLALRSDAGPTTDDATELTAINADDGGGAGDYVAGDSQEGIRDSGGGDATEAKQDTIIADLANGTDGLSALKTLIDTVNSDLANGTDGLGALKTLLDAIPTTAMRGTDSAALATALATAQLDLDTITGADGVILLSATQSTIDAIPTTAMRGTDSAALPADVWSDSTPPAGAAMARAVDGIVLGTASGTPTTTSIPTSSLVPAAAVIDQFKGRIVTFDDATTTAALRGQSTDITASTAAGVLTVTALTTAPVSGDTFTIQ